MKRRLWFWVLDHLSADTWELCNAWGGSGPDGSVRLCDKHRWHIDSHTYELIGPGHPTGPYRRAPLPFT
jgi:hypothetical protein